MTNHDIGERVRQVIAGRRQQDVAAAVEMTPDAFSRSLNGRRAFSTLELALVADLVGADVHWLITGQADPLALRLAARHTTDPRTFERSVPGQEEDAPVLRNVELAYRTVDVPASGTGALPRSAEDVRTALGEGFAREFVRRVEGRLGVDVVRLGEISTDYSLVVAGRTVVVLRGGPHWYRENFGLAHELAHHCLRHHGGGITDVEERAANAFAAELLMPEPEMRAQDWAGMPPAELAVWLWEHGVSTSALARRLKALRLPARRELTQGTELFLRSASPELPGGLGTGAAITHRSASSARRRFPEWLQERHRDGITSGAVQPEALAWMLAVDPATFAEDLPDREPQRAAQAGGLAELDALFGIA